MFSSEHYQYISKQCEIIPELTSFLNSLENINRATLNDLTSSLDKENTLFHYLHYLCAKEEYRDTNAAEHIERCFLLDPDNKLFIDCYFTHVTTKEKLERAAKQVTNAINVNPSSTNLRIAECYIQIAKDNYLPAYKKTLSLPYEIRQQKEVLDIIFKALPSIPVAQLTHEIFNDLISLMQNENVSSRRFKDILPFIVKKLVNYFSKNSISAEDINQHKFFNTALRYRLLQGEKIELFITELRKTIILSISAEPTREINLFEILLSIAMQADKNEYIYYYTNSEQALVQEYLTYLEGNLVSPTVSARTTVLPLLLLLMYTPPADLPHQDILLSLDFSYLVPELNEFLRHSIDNHNKQLKYSEEFAEQANLNNPTSKKVALQYESHPYPRWTERIYARNPQALEYDVFLDCVKSPNWSPQYNLDFKKVLVAGCGTGQHPIQKALLFPTLDFEAIDLSCRSLGYAKMMAERHNVQNLSFQHGDLLQLDDHGLYDIIECGGVLHHLKEPSEGLASLVPHLRPGGILCIALYSEKSRKTIKAFRTMLEKSNVQVDETLIRESRRNILNQSTSTYADITSVGDFYSMSGCRDLIFHEQEHQFTIQGIKDFIAPYPLKFLKFERQSYIDNVLKGSRYENISYFDIDSWGEAEEDYPQIFKGMYVFYCQYQP